MNQLRHSLRWMLSLGAFVAATALAGAQAPSSRLVVVTKPPQGGPVAVILNPADGKILGKVPIGPDPAGVVGSDDGKLAFIVNTNSHDTGLENGDSLSVIDMAAMKEIHHIPIGQATAPHDVKFAGGKVFFTAQGWKSVGCYDPQHNRIEWMLGLGQDGTHAMSVSKDANWIVAPNQSGTISIVDGVVKGPPRWKVTTLPGGKDPEGADISPDGKEAWVANKNSAGGGVTIVDLATKKVKQDVDLQTKHANRMRFTPDGKYVLLLDREAQELLIVDATSRMVAKRIKAPGQGPSVWDLTVAPDSAHAYVTISQGANPNRYDEKGEVVRASEGDRSVIGKSEIIAEIDLKTLSISRQLPTDLGGDAIAWVGK